MAIRTFASGPSGPAAAGQRTNTHADLVLLERARPWAVLLKFADKKLVPKNKSESVTWRRAINPTADNTVVTEGVNPASRALAYEDVTGTFEEFAEVFEVSSRARELAEDDIVRDSADVLKDLVIRTKELNSWETYRANSSIAWNASAHTAITDVDGAISLGRLQLAITEIETAQGEPFTEVDNGGMKQGSHPLEPAYICFVHTHARPDIRALPGFIPTAAYGGGAASVTCPYEFGAVENIRFVTTPHLTPFLAGGADVGSTGMRSAGASKVDVYPFVIIARHAIGCADLKGTGMRGYGGVKVKVIDGESKSDPTNQRTYVSCRWWDLPVRLNESWMYQIQAGVTANPT